MQTPMRKDYVLERSSKLPDTVLPLQFESTKSRHPQLVGKTDTAVLSPLNN